MIKLTWLEAKRASIFPPSPRKSGIPDSVDMPAPVNAIALLEFESNFAASCIFFRQLGLSFVCSFN